MYRTAVIRPGVYVPGGGPLAGQRVAISEDFIRNAGPSIEGEPVNLGHSPNVEDEVGFHRNHAVETDDNGVVLRADLQIQSSRQRFEDAVSFIESRLAAGDVPEYSMELPTSELEWREARTGETFNGEEFDIMLTDGAFAGGALLTEGACTAEDGCGVGLSTDSETTNFCPSCGDELPCEESQAGTVVHTGLSGTTRKRTTMTDEDPDTSEGSGGPTSEDYENLQEQFEDLKEEVSEMQSRETPDEEPSNENNLDTELEAEKERIREGFRSQIEAEKGEGFVEDRLGEDPSLEQLSTAHQLVQAEAGTEEEPDEEPENTEASSPERKTNAQRGPGQDTIVTRSGEEMNLEAYNAVRERFGFDPVEDPTDLNPNLPSAFKRAAEEPDGEASLFYHMGRGGGG